MLMLKVLAFMVVNLVTISTVMMLNRWLFVTKDDIKGLPCFQMKNGKEFLLTDSVGFIQKLPTTMIDKASDPLKIKLEAEKRKDAVCISAINGNGLDEFCSAVQEKLKVVDVNFFSVLQNSCFCWFIFHMCCVAWKLCKLGI
ncbi:uncharacterized protein LOC114292248 isoform X6 [Camellia sinensis]|uniref:uncharacterized protein LOC114292248 isoform X6 n=1 Tax=Camellia sinensis TaxID=4442 RepID=UPI001036769A|nr:uncharacterized protein LOC114292248 isoform X6 [Camellia sinensis]